MSALHPEPRVKHLPIPRGAGRGWNKPWRCQDCGLRRRSREAIEAHWRAEHAPKPRVCASVTTISVKVEESI